MCIGYPIYIFFWYNRTEIKAKDMIDKTINLNLSSNILGTVRIQ
ncbi:MAG: hypothetical protein PWP67_275 [Clostridium butyricum]|nr:hypothetical protein [Clostridium butyricum]